MCWSCDNPEASENDYLGVVRQTISTSGWAIQGIEGSGPYPPFSYTVGRTAQDLPELVVTGLPSVTAQELLNTVAAQSSTSSDLAHGGRLTVAGMSLEVVALPEPTAHLFVAVAIYGSQITALQLVHADGVGNWPWASDYSADHRQPVLGPRAVNTDSNTTSSSPDEVPDR